VTALSWTRRVSAALRVRAPGVYRSLRRAYALVEYAGWRFAGQRDGDAYGESFWDLHADAGWDWAGFAACIQCYAKSHAVVDVGCGDAKVLAELLRVDATLRVQGYDGSPEARARAAQRGVLVAPLDFARDSAAERARIRAACAEFDTALCFEVAEHLFPWHAGRLLALLSACPTVVFSAAHAGQGGTLHVNERPASYWMRRFAALGYALSPDDANFRRDLAALTLPPWYAQNAHLFRRA